MMHFYGVLKDAVMVHAYTWTHVWTHPLGGYGMYKYHVNTRNNIYAMTTYKWRGSWVLDYHILLPERDHTPLKSFQMEDVHV